MVHFTLYSRSYCHLCEDMHQQLLVFAADYRFTVEVIDIDEQTEYLSQYDELVPVLVGKKVDPANQAPTQLCHYFLDRGLVKAFLDEAK